MLQNMIKIIKLPVPLILVLALITGGFFTGKIFGNMKTVASSTPVLTCPGAMDQIRLQDYELVYPLILTDVSEQSESLREIQSNINSYINQAKADQKATDISVYFRRLDNGAWFSINPNTTYNPASMVKIVYLITYLKMAEKNPQVLNRKIFFSQHFSAGNSQNIVDFQLRENQNYSVEELLEAMIKHSDNDATLLLSQNMDVNIYNKIFKDLDIELPNPVTEYYISVGDFGKFFRILYSATYLSTQSSEYALNLLTKSTYKDGLKKGIPDNLRIAHKFGERIIGNKAQLHEFGIVYINKSPYLIGVMSSGNSLTQLSSIIGDISKIAFTNYKTLIQPS